MDFNSRDLPVRLFGFRLQVAITEGDIEVTLDI